MKNEYGKKKKTIILVLVAAAVCLVGGLGYCLTKSAAPAEPDGEEAQRVVGAMEFSVPEIDLADSLLTGEAHGVENPENAEPASESSETEASDTPAVQNRDGDSEAPKAREDAQPPSERPQTQDDTGNPKQPPQYEPEVTEPEQKPQEPAGGSTNEEGQIYVPGFGYMDAPGAPVSIPVGSDGDWDKQIGDM